jgi:hypothetical protein
MKTLRQKFKDKPKLFKFNLSFMAIPICMVYNTSKSSIIVHTFWMEICGLKFIYFGRNGMIVKSIPGANPTKFEFTTTTPLL